MNFELFIAKSILSGKENSSRVTAPIIRIAVAGVAIGMMVMILAIAIVRGFQKEIRDKASGFGGHITIQPFDLNASFEKKPMNLNIPGLDADLASDPNIEHYEAVAEKAGIIKSGKAIEGIVLKGIGKDFDKSFFEKNLKSGKIFSLSDSTVNDIVISTYTASRLKLKTGDDVILFFAEQPPRMRRLTISGIYETGFEEMDKMYALCDIGHIRKLNGWNDHQAAGIEVFVKDYATIDETKERLNGKLGYDLKAETIAELNPQLFDWLGLQDLNGIILITLIVMVCSINMISALLILILERTRTIGVLKAMGAQNVSVRKIFLYIAAALLFSGILAGNILGLGLAFIQKNYGIIKLDQKSYYIPFVPIHLEPGLLLLLNIGTILICTLLLILPTIIITKISPVKAIRFS